MVKNVRESSGRENKRSGTGNDKNEQKMWQSVRWGRFHFTNHQSSVTVCCILFSLNFSALQGLHLLLTTRYLCYAFGIQQEVDYWIFLWFCDQGVGGEGKSIVIHCEPGVVGGGKPTRTIWTTPWGNRPGQFTNQRLLYKSSSQQLHTKTSGHPVWSRSCQLATTIHCPKHILLVCHKQPMRRKRWTTVTTRPFQWKLFGTTSSRK